MSLSCAVPEARYSRSVNVQRRYVHRRGELGSTSGVDRRAVFVSAEGCGIALVLVGVRGGYRLMTIDEGVDDVLSVVLPLE